MAFFRRFALGVSLVCAVVVVCSHGLRAQRAASDLKAIARQSLARIDGELKAPHLKQPVEIIRDRWGVPHIYAQNTDDLFFAQGFVTAQDRLWQMDWWKRSREGRLAEGIRAPAFERDRQTRL